MIPRIPRPRWFARFLNVQVGKVAAGSFKDVTKDGCEGEYGGIKIAASNAVDIERVKTALMELRTISPNSEKRILGWIERIIFVDNTIRWSQFCDGTVFFWSKDHLPHNVLVSYLYRWATQICIYKRFGYVEVVTGNPRCRLISDRAQLRLMRVLNCGEPYIEHIRTLMLKNVAEHKFWRHKCQ